MQSLLKTTTIFSVALSILASVSIVHPNFLFAQTAESVTARRAQLQAELDAIQAEIDSQKKILDDRQRQSVSLERDIAILNAKIGTAKLNIKARNIVIQGLADDIKEKEGTIRVLGKKIDREKDSLAQIIRQTNEKDSYSIAEVVLSETSISKFFEDVDRFQAINASLQNSFHVISDTKSATEDQKSSLEDKLNEETDLRKIQELEKKKTEDQEKQKQTILKLSRGVEQEYQKIIKAKEKSAAVIRTELFTLQGSASIPFEKALSLAMDASKKTGVRPAIILGIIAEESNLGQNVGTGSWLVDMKNPRDTVPFQSITSRLGLDPNKMPVSKKPWYGYGGAMGPAQFIPSTWVLYEAKIANATGHNPPNPWDPGDAFMASGILMAENGATTQTRSAERLAALRYLAGWTNATKKAYAFYGDDVMELADKYQKQIDILNGN